MLRWAVLLFTLVACTGWEDDGWEDDDDSNASLIHGTIMEAVNDQNWEKVVAMAESGEHDLDVKNEYQETALHMTSAPHLPQIKALKALIAAGATLDIQDADGCTPLIWAVHNNHYENAQLLLEAGAAWSEVRDAKGRTAKEHALSSKMRSLFTKPGLEADIVVSTVVDVEDFAEEVEHAEVDVCLLVYSTSCGHCREFAPVFEDIAAMLRSTSIRFRQLDLHVTQPSASFSASSTPTLFLKKVGVDKPLVYDGDKTPKDIIHWLQERVTYRFMWTQGESGEVPLQKVLDRQAALTQHGESSRPPLHPGDEL